MVINESKISNIMGDLENSSGVKLNTHRRKLKQRFDIVKKLGQGTYGKVQLAINKETGQEVAIKTIKKCMIETEADLVRIRREIQIMSSVQHPNIIHIYEVFENREKIVLVMEYASGGELYDYLFERLVLEEDESRRIFRQIATAVYYCHKHKICHRDLKLENILLDADGNAKIADFGLSNVFNGGCLLSTFCGSPLYASPEIVNGTPYLGPEVDCWSLGVLLYTLVYGAMPFDGSHFKRLVKQISNGYFFEPSTPSPASELIHEMLTVSPEKRANIEKICSHWWINETYNESCLQIAEKFANQTPVRLDLLLSLVPPPNASSENIVITDELDSSSGQPNNSSASVAKSQSDGNIPMTSNDYNKICPKRKLEVTISTENANQLDEPSKRKDVQLNVMVPFQPSATFVIKDNNEHFSADNKNDELVLSNLPVASMSNEKKADGSKIPTKKKIIKKKSLTVDNSEVNGNNKTSSIPIVNNKLPVSERRSSKIFETAEKFQNLLLENQQNKNTVQPFRKISIPGIVNVGGFKKEFERKASLGTTPSNLPTIKPTVQRKSLISPLLDKFSQEEKPIKCENDTEKRKKKAIHIISNAIEGNRKVMVKSKPVLNYATRSYSLNSNNDTKKIEYPIEKTQSEDVNGTYRTPISYITKSNRDSDSSQSKDIYKSSENNSNHTLQSSDSNCPSTTSRSSVNESIGSQSKEHIIPIEYEKKTSVNVQEKNNFRSRLPQQAKPPVPNTLKRNIQSKKPTLSRQSTQDSSDVDVKTASGEPIRRSPREYIIPISVEGGGFVTPKESSVEKTDSQHVMNNYRQSSIPKFGIQRRISSVSSDHDLSEDDLLCSVKNRRPKSLSRDSDNDELENNLFNLRRLRSTKPFHRNRFDSDKNVLSSGDEEDEDENFDILTAENLFSTLLQRVRNLTQQMNSNQDFDEKFFNNSEDDWPFSSNILRKPGATAYTSSTLPRDKKQLNSSTSQSSSPNKLKNNKKIEFIQELQSKLTDEELLTLLTPGLSRRLQKQLLKQFLSKDPKFRKLKGEKDQNEISNEFKKIANDISELTTKTINTDSTLTSNQTMKSVNELSNYNDSVACSSHNQIINNSSTDNLNDTSQKGTQNDVNNERPKSMILNEVDKVMKNVELQTSKLPIFRKKSLQELDKKIDFKMLSEVEKRRSLPLLDDKLVSNHRASICSNATCDDDLTTATTASFDSWSGCSSDLHSPMPYTNADRASSTISRSMTPRLFDETESISDRIRRKSFYTRFNEWRSPKKSSSPSSSSLVNYNMYSTLPRRSFDSSLSSITSLSSRPNLFANRKCERSHSVNARSLANSSSTKPSSLRLSKYQISPISSHRPASFLLPTYSTSYSR